MDDDSVMSAFSTPLRTNSTNSDFEGSFEGRNVSYTGLEIPPSDTEDVGDEDESLIDSSTSSDDEILGTPVEAPRVLKTKQNNLLRRSLGFRSALEDNLGDSSHYESFQSAATLSPKIKNSGNESSLHESGSVHSDNLEGSEVSDTMDGSAVSDNFDGSSVSEKKLSHQEVHEMESFQLEQNSSSHDDSVLGQKKKRVVHNDIDSDDSNDSIDHVNPSIEPESKNNEQSNSCAADLNDSNWSGDVALESSQELDSTDVKSESFCSNKSHSSATYSNDEINVSGHVAVEPLEDMGNNSVDQVAQGTNVTHDLSDPELIQVADASIQSNVLSIQDHDENMSDNFNNSNGAVSHQDQAHELFSSPRSSLIDLTQSDSSLQNSPVGATRQQGQVQRDVGVVVAELSAVNNDIMVKEALLDSINTQTLPDNGRNLRMKVSELKMQKVALQKELEENTEYAAQKAMLGQMQTNLQKKILASTQSTLNFQPSVKPEPKEYRDRDSEDDGSPGSSSSHSLSIKPNWGDLPNPDMTISGFGKRAMQTHLAEKSMTIEALSSLHNALKSCPSEDTYAEDPKYLKVELMPHQKHGLAWMLWREQEKPPGGILADDMGLGKTLSMISLILKSQESKENSDNDSESDDDAPKWLSSKYSRMPRGGTLVVCPASLVAQWEHEIYKRVKKRALSVELYHGPKRETKPRRLAKYDVVVTTYNLVSRESGVETAKNAIKMKEKGPLFMVKWDRIILDEAHMVRNHKSQMALGVCELVGKHRWCLTGTPIQNKELDLYALLKFLQVSPFDDLVVWKKWVDNKNAAGMQRLNTMMKSLMLRRTKELLQEKGDLKCLPGKQFQVIDVHLDPEELVLYEKIALFSQSLFADFLAQRAEKQQLLDARYGTKTKPVWEQEEEGPDNQFVTTKDLANMHRKMKGITEIKTHQILVLLLRLRQTCCHPGLIKKMVEDGDLDFEGGVEDKNGLDVDLFNQMNNLNINESDLEKEDGEDELNKSGHFAPDNPILSFDRPSAKIRAILDLVEKITEDSDDKAIIVSQWASVLKIIEVFLKQMQIRYDTLSGAVPVDKRQDIVNEINKEGRGPQVLLLSLTAGGVGLNLVGANHLLLVDIHWNPQLEAQACDRIYRVGQKKDVHVYRFITVNTIEERIRQLQEKKLAMAEMVLTGTRNTEASKLTLADLKMLFSAPTLPEIPPPAPQQPAL